MPEGPELDNELERVKESIDEAREEEKGSRRLLTRISLSTALIAVIAALASLQAGDTVNEALLKKNESIAVRTQAFDEWSHFQAKGIKAAILQSQRQTLIALDRPPAISLDEEIVRYKKEQEELTASAKRDEENARRLAEEAEHLIRRHHRFASSVALLQIAVALSAIAAISRNRPMWLLSLATALAGSVLFLDGFFPFL